ncbi:glycosyltransferase family 87 protein [Corynebacterium glutamicum]|uniref:glycosyltransferase family 87 protein n=1 Tax=Corynebacterium glutamicum TaxID=1718 RepID=UPI000B354308|nr:glycosyltransferase family 87 protein [Corynebacterium glutamicum]
MDQKLDQQKVDRVSPGDSEPVARDFINAIGGRFGRFAQVGTQRFWTPLRVLITTSLVFLAMGFLTKANCIQGSRGTDGVVSLNWSGSRQYTSACYNDIVPLYGGRGIDAPGFPYAFSWQEGDLTRYMEYPVLGGIFQWICGIITRFLYPVIDVIPFHTLPESGLYFIVTALALAFFWVLVIRMMVELTGNRVWDTVLVAASPLVAVHAFTNWDTPAIAAVIGAMLAVKRGNPLVAGVLIGAGTAFKLWPLYLLGAYLVLAVKNKNLKPFITMAAAAAVTWLVVNVPVMIAYPKAWNEFLRLNRERGAEWTTIYQVIDRNLPINLNGPVLLNVLSFGLFGASCVAILILGLKVQRTPRVAELAFLIVAAFLLFNKVWSPQYSLWLVPLAVLAFPQWKVLFPWMVTDAMVWPILMWHMLGTDNKGLPHEMLDLIVISRDAFIVVMIVGVIRQMLGRRADPVMDAHAGRDLLAGPFGAGERRKALKEVS